MKVIAILPAFKAEHSLEKFLKIFPFNLFDEVILCDDCSPDKTYEAGKKNRKLAVYRTLRNLGYGGNVKTCLSIALKRGADVIIELHPDGEYGFDGIEPAIQEVKEGAHFVLGNRFSEDKNALKTGMYKWKYPFMRSLNFIDNTILGTHVSDLHQGFRVYTKKLLESVNFRATSNNYIFSFEIIAQAAAKKMKFASIPVSTHYEGKKRGASLKASLLYSLGTFHVLTQFVLAKLGIRLRLFSDPVKSAVCPNCKTDALVFEDIKGKEFTVFFCTICENGFTYPVPQSMKQHYFEGYWSSISAVGKLKKFIFSLFQTRRDRFIKRYLSRGSILDVGAGEGEFSKRLNEEFTVTNIDTPFADVKNATVLRTEFLSWKSNTQFDAIVFWESLEHVENPQEYLGKAAKLLKKGGYLFVEYPVFGSLESKLFGANWYHLDLPRHLVHFTKNGLSIIGERVGLEPVDEFSTFAAEYSIWGFVASFIQSVSGVRARKLEKTFAQPTILLFVILLTPLSFLFEVVLYFLNKSPLSMKVFQKKYENNQLPVLSE